MYSLHKLLFVSGLRLVLSLPVEADTSTALGSSDFSKFVADNKLVLVNFCTPGEMKCRKLSHEWTIAATDSADETLKFATVNCEKSKDLCDKYKVSSYPTVMAFESGSASDIVSPLKSSIINAVAQQLKTPPAVKQLKTEADLTSFQEQGLSLIAFTDTHNSDCFDVFEAVATRPALPASFGAAPSELLSKVWDGPKSESGPTILLKAPFSKKPVVFSNTDCSVDSLNAFIKTESFPVFGPITNTNYNQYVNRGLPIVWCFLENNEKMDDYISILEKASEGTKGKLSWVHLDADTFNHHAVALGLSGDKWPGVVIENQKEKKEKKKFLVPSETKFTSSALSEFASKVLAGDILPWVKSQSVPEDDTSAMKTVVGKSYEDVVLKSKPDVFLMVHAHWCRHCQLAMPRINETAQLLTNLDSVVVAAVDADLNDVPIDYQGFPTIYFLAAGKKDKPIPFNGQRTVEGFTAFILEHATKEVPAAEKKSFLDQAKKADEQLDKPSAPSQADDDAAKVEL